eukprot:TRINITY_DN2334_c0_g1_i3.p1 TRINITY_DN2334_c0_g1~~TRINITY_DN2334_c0_g1_i3.p1  ORF type:complete len:638 (-),score=174.28 TRINITY_DN2334_c0_g1_i3:39-1952(-)
MSLEAELNGILPKMEIEIIPELIKEEQLPRDRAERRAAQRGRGRGAPSRGERGRGAPRGRGRAQRPRDPPRDRPNQNRPGDRAGYEWAQEDHVDGNPDVQWGDPNVQWGEPNVQWEEQGNWEPQMEDRQERPHRNGDRAPPIRHPGDRDYHDRDRDYGDRDRHRGYGDRDRRYADRAHPIRYPGRGRDYGDREYEERRGYGRDERRGGDNDNDNAIQAEGPHVQQFNMQDNIMDRNNAECQRLAPLTDDQYFDEISTKYPVTVLPAQTWKSCRLASSITSAIQFEEMSECQKIGIPMVMSKDDTIIQAGSGTGKTVVFALPAVETADPRISSCQILVLVPKRELALQTTRIMTPFAEKKRLSILTAIGGTRIRSSDDQIVVGTLGRVYDLMQRGTIDMTHIRLVILDEAETLLSRDFIDSLRNIYARLPRQDEFSSCLIGTTFCRYAIDLAMRFLRLDRLQMHLQTLKENGMPIRASQYYILVDESDKIHCFEELIGKISFDDGPMIVFTATTLKCDWVVQQIQNRLGQSAEGYHGSMTETDRESVLTDFINNRINILVSTPVLESGIDLPRTRWIVNWDPLSTQQQYVNRCGRCTRLGSRNGTVISFLNDTQKGDLVEYFHDIKPLNVMKPVLELE